MNSSDATPCRERQRTGRARDSTVMLHSEGK